MTARAPPTSRQSIVCLGPGFKYFRLRLIVNLPIFCGQTRIRCEAYGAFPRRASDKERQSRAQEKCRALTLPWKPGQASHRGVANRNPKYSNARNKGSERTT